MDIMSFSYWGFISLLEVGSERYKFFKVDHQTVLCEERNQYLTDQTEVIWAFMNLITPLMALNLLWSSLKSLLSISKALHFPLPISEISETYISFMSIKVFSLSPQSFRFGLFCFSLLYFDFNNPNWLFFKSFCCNLSYIELLELWKHFN